VYVYVVKNNTCDDTDIDELRRCIDYFKDKVSSNKNLIFVNKASEILKDDIDLIFLSNLPHSSKLFSLVSASRCLLIYLPYSYHIDKNDRLQVGKIQHVSLWRHYVPHKYFKKASKKYNNATAVIATGYPIFDYPANDNSLTFKRNLRSVWPTDTKIKVIWAPHHSIESGNNWPYFSTFLTYYSYFLALANDSTSKFTICFKPHPIMRQKLIDHPEWGLERQQAYYKAWADSKNGFLQDGIYNDLFLQSDCMVFDSVSFTAEYLLMNKPSCFLTREDKGSYTSFLNEVGLEFMEYHRKASSSRELSAFLSNMDSTQQKQIKRPQNFSGLSRDGTATRNIIQDLESSLPMLTFE